MGIESRLDEAIRTIPPLPEIALRILEVAANPEFAVDDLVVLVRTDPGLTTRILQISNSSLYSASHEVTSVRDALGYLGSRNLVRVVITACARQSFGGGVETGPYSPDEILTRSIQHAFLAEALAKESGEVDPALAFTTGILHDIGRVAMSVAGSLSGVPLLPPGGRSFGGRSIRDWERSIFGKDHCEVGIDVLEFWSVPVEIRRALRFHHDAERLPTESALAAILYVAEHCANGGSVDAAGSDPLLAAALERLSLSQDRLRELRKEATQSALDHSQTRD